MKRRDFLSSAAIVPVAGAAVPAALFTEAAEAQGADKGSKAAKTAPKVRNLKHPAVDYDHPACDQFGIGPDGKPISDNLTGTGSDHVVKEHDPSKPHKMTLTQEEQDIINGSQGEVMAKVLKTIVRHGELFGAERLADCGGRPHSSLYTGSPWVTPVLEMFEEIADAGLKSFAPYTVNPMVIDLFTVGRDPVKRSMELEGFPLQGRLIEVHTRLGAVPLNDWSCACYLPQIGNTAEPGTVVTWAESSAVNYGNSVLGLRVNRMATGMEVLCAIAGKVPVFGLVTDEGRVAKWHIDVRLSEEPHWGVLGTAVGFKVVDQVPYYTGIDQWIGMEDGKPDPIAVGKLKGMGSSSAASGAVGLYHVEKVTPEAIEQGRDLLTDDHQTYVIDDAEYARIRENFPNLWKDPKGDPSVVAIGCPHNTYEEMVYWCEKLDKALKDAGQDKLAIPVALASAVTVKELLFDEHPLLCRDMKRAGVKFTHICTPMFMGLKGMADMTRGVTNSGKARTYTNLRIYDDDNLVKIAMTGKAPY